MPSGSLTSSWRSTARECRRRSGGYGPEVEDEVWAELDRDVGRVLWAEFADRFRFRLGIAAGEFPAIIEPTLSVVWDLGSVFAGDFPGGFRAGVRMVAASVLGTLQDCTDWWESVAFHDYAHPSCLMRPHKVDEPEDVPGWDVGGLFPNGDYTIFVGRDHGFGILGHPFEHSLCVFGESAVSAFTTRINGALTVLRRDGQPLPTAT
jgi:hypothetical protein